MSACERHELALGEPGYPAGLAMSPRPPKVLYVAGPLEALRQGLAVVGARRATPYGLHAARQFAGWAAAHGVTIVSGAACGCDQSAQQAAVDAGGSSVAVLGCGADVDYPSSSRSLLERLRMHGAVVSELPWGTPPTRGAFPARNRLIAALSQAVLVVEAGLPSGTFSTAEHAAAASRDVWAVPGSIFAPESRGANRLIADGAQAITDVTDLAEALRIVDLLPDGPVTAPDLVIDAADPLLRALIADPMRPDDVARELALDIVEVVRRIGRLEAAGLVSRRADGRYGSKGW
jgi:DNA processing protein